MDRAIAARERLAGVLDVARKAREAGPPCSDCRYRTLLNNCGNPAYAEPRFEPSSGTYAEAFSTPIKSARSDDGLCGPEALLFETQSLPVFVARSVGNGIKVAYLSLAAVVLAITVLGMAMGRW